MRLHAGVTKVVTGSARKRLQPHRLVKFEGSAATGGAQQAQALAYPLIEPYRTHCSTVRGLVFKKLRSRIDCA
jgi:hypothetical protein